MTPPHNMYFSVLKSLCLYQKKKESFCHFILGFLEESS